MSGIRAEKIPSMEERKKIREALKKQKEAQADTTAAIEQSTSCANCGEKIGVLEKGYTFEGNVVCAKCYEKLKSTPQTPCSYSLGLGAVMGRWNFYER